MFNGSYGSVQLQATGFHSVAWSLGASAPQPFRDSFPKGGCSPGKGGTGSYPPCDKGLHRKMRQRVYRPPRKIPCRTMASIAYSEQVGTKRQAGGNMGEMQYLYRRMGKIAMHRSSLVIPVSSRPGEAPCQHKRVDNSGLNSCSTTAREINNGFSVRLGTITMSCPVARSVWCNRKNSRTTRLTRLRRTAHPVLRVTARPRRQTSPSSRLRTKITNCFV